MLACPSEKTGSPRAEDVGGCDGTYLSHRESCCRACIGHLFLPDAPVCRANINKRIHNLHTSILDGQDNYFASALEAYHPGIDITAEFPTASLLLEEYGDAVPPFATLWGEFCWKR